MDHVVYSTLNYISSIEKWETIKPYEITGRLNPGLERNNFKFTSHPVKIEDMRFKSTPPRLGKDGFEWIQHVTDERLDNEESISRHILEVENFLKMHLGVDHVLAFQYQVGIILGEIPQ